jgi:hypothetical protein
LADKLSLLIVNRDRSEIIIHWNSERTGIELVDAQSAIRYFNEMLAFARNINAPYFMVCAIKETRLLPIRAMDQAVIERLASKVIRGSRNPGLSDKEAFSLACYTSTNLQHVRDMEAVTQDFHYHSQYTAAGIGQRQIWMDVGACRFCVLHCRPSRDSRTDGKKIEGSESNDGRTTIPGRARRQGAKASGFVAASSHEARNGLPMAFNTPDHQRTLLARVGEPWRPDTANSSLMDALPSRGLASVDALPMLREEGGEAAQRAGQLPL